MRIPSCCRDQAAPRALLLSLAACLLSGAVAPSQSPTCQGQGPLLNVTGGRFGDPWSVGLSGPPGAAAILGVDPAPGPIATPFGAVCVGLSGGLITTPVTLDAAGNFATGGLLPLVGGPPALSSLFLQAAVADPTLPFGFGLTNGWAASFRPPRLGVFTSAVVNGTGVLAQGNVASIDPITDTVVSSTPAAALHLSYIMRVPRLGWFAVPMLGVGLQFRDDVSGAQALGIWGLIGTGQYAGPASFLTVSSDGSRLVVIVPQTAPSGGPMVSVYGLPSGALLATIPLFTSQGQMWAHPVPGTTLVYVADMYWVRVLDTSTATMVAQVFLPGTLNSIPLQAGNLLYSSTTAGLFAMDVTTHAIVLGPVPTGQPNARLVAIGPGPAGSAVYAAGGSAATGYSLMACSPATLAVQGAVGLPAVPNMYVWTNTAQMNLSAGGTEWLIDLWNPATSQELWAVNAATLQPSFVMPSSGTTVLRSGTLRKAYALTGPTTLVPILTDPVGAPLPPITLPAAAGAVISN